ncbi:hypothetical protein J3R82DRAFT_2322 [Butyriboletus roseoflavus]|nr:hypothetical protein J3R82DRAFT_2322 [Butyriboletus roseoflavus]
MGPSAKKRKEPPPNRTLLDFFSNADAAIKRARVRTRQQLAPTVRQTNSKAASREVIVIDSDSDGDVLGKENGKRSARMNIQDRAHPLAEDKDGFGAPSELLRPINLRVEVSSDWFHAHQHSPIAPKPDHSESMFGDISSFAGTNLRQFVFLDFVWVRDGLNLSCTGNQLIERSQTNLVAHDSTSTMAGGNSADDPTAEFSIGEWAVRDDELVALEALDNGAETDEGEGEPSDEQCSCPVCGIDLTGIVVRCKRAK